MSTVAPAGRPDDASPRFLPLTEVAEVLNISVTQSYALVRRGELAAIKVGGRGQWRVETRELERYITDAYASTRQFIAEHPFATDEPPISTGPLDVRPSSVG